jgi:asparagine synthetase B (glutamine-hydrolysing)
MDVKTIATFGKHMICPKIDDEDLATQGWNDFITYHYRHNSNNYTGNSIYTNDTLLEHLKIAISNTCDHTKIPLLLLSDGKDSLSLALAFSELGVKIHTLTILRRNDVSMKSYLQDIATKLGFFSYFITVDEIVGAFDESFFKKSFRYMNNPVLDQGYLFFLLGLKIFFEKNNFNSQDFQIVDGLGNDEYFGYLMSKQQWSSFKFSRLGIWKIVPKYLKNLKWYIRSPIESHGDLSTLACFFNFSSSYDLNKYFSRISKSTQKEKYLDLRAFSRGSFHDHQCMMGKTDVAAQYIGSSCVFPYLDQTLANYCFNIPIDKKLDFNNKVNKIPLRKLLSETIGWNQKKRGADFFLDLDLDYFHDQVISRIVPQEFIDIIKNNKILGKDIKKRAYLELLNFYTYCTIRAGMNKNEIREILY